MNHAITVELQFFLLSVLWGAIILLAYDFLRIFRRLLPQGTFFLAIEDLLFWIMASVFIFAMIYRENNGIIRGFTVMGMSIGMVLYHYIFSEFFVNLITKIIRTLMRPFSLAIKQTKKLALFLISKVKKVVLFFLLRLKKLCKSVKIAISKRKQAAESKRKISHNQKMQKKQAMRQQKQQQQSQQRKGPENKGERNRQKEQNNRKEKNKPDKKQSPKVKWEHVDTRNNK